MMTMKRWAIVLGIACIAVNVAGCGGSGGAQGSAGRSGAISGRAVDQSGKPVKGAKVQLMQANRSVSRAIATTTTDVNGHFTLVDVAAGTYTVVVSTTSSNGTLVDVQVDVTVPAGTTIDLTITIHQTAPVVIPTTGSVTGFVFDARSGNPIVGAQVTLISVDHPGLPSLKTFTTSDGTFRFDMVTVGLWQLKASAHDSSSTRVLVDVNAGVVSSTDLTISLREDD